LRKVISSIPAFESGIDNTSSLSGVGSGGVDGRGGFHAILHPNEAVFNAEDNAKKGILTNAQAANVLEAYNKGYLSDVNITPAEKNDNNTALLYGIGQLIASNKKIEKSVGVSQEMQLDTFLNLAKVITKKGNTKIIDKYDLF